MPSKQKSLAMAKVLVRADASSKIGTGHIMRCLVLAEAFQENGDDVVFLTRPLMGNMDQKITNSGFEVISLASDGIDAEMDEVAELIKSEAASMIVFDHYGIDAAYEKEIKKRTGVTVMSLDDTYEKHDCDIVLNHNISADATRYAGRVPAHCELRCGPHYTLLRGEFTSITPRARVINHEKINVFVAMGGADHTNIALDVLQTLLRHPAMHATVVTTSVNRHLDALRDFAAVQRRIALHVDATQIAERMNAADLAVITPSVIANEVIYLELPFIAVKTADNQQDMAEFLQRHDIAVLERFDADMLYRQFNVLINHYDAACTAVQRLKQGDF